MQQRPPAPVRNNVRTYYENPLIDRFTGHYTVAWDNGSEPQSIRVHNRLTDLEGRAPSWFSLRRLPQVVKSYLDARRHPILPEPVPFLVWDAIRRLEAIVRPGMRVLEIGGGNSTLWFLDRGVHLTTVEHSPEWAAHVRSFVVERLGVEAEARLQLHVEHGPEALRRIEELADGSFDLVLVDCMNAFTWRKDCVERARPKLRPGGWMVLDNSDHPNNWGACELMADLPRERHTGWAPMCSVVTQTSFWRIGSDPATGAAAPRP